MDTDVDNALHRLRLEDLGVCGIVTDVGLEGLIGGEECECECDCRSGMLRIEVGDAFFLAA